MTKKPDVPIDNEQFLEKANKLLAAYQGLYYGLSTISKDIDEIRLELSSSFVILQELSTKLKAVQEADKKLFNI